MVASSVERRSEMPHSRKKSPLTNSALPTTGTLMVRTVSFNVPTYITTDMDFLKQWNGGF